MASFPFAFWKDPTGSVPVGFGFNYGYDFDGVDESLSIPVSLGLNSSDAFSFSFWYKMPVSSNVTEEIINYPGSSNNGIIIRLLSGKLNIIVTGVDNTRVDAVTQLTYSSKDLWYHVVWTKNTGQDTTDLTCYVNGAPVTTNQQFLNNLSSNTAIGHNELLIGGRTAFFDGRIDEVQTYDFELNSTQVSDIYNSGYVTAPTASPTHHWKLGEEDTFSTNWTVKDSIGSADGSSVNMEETDRKLGVAYSMKFDGVDEYVDFGNVLDLTGTDAFSFSFCIKPTASGMILSKCQYSFPGLGYYISVDNNGSIELALRVNAGTNKLVVRGANVGLNVWNICTITYDGSQNGSGVKIYSNGVEGSTIITDNLTSSISNSVDFNIGSISNGNTLFDGNIMNVAKFDSELSAADAALLYNTTGLNNGVPIDPRDVGLNPTFFAPLGGPNDSFNGTDWTITDEINGNNGTSVNMEEADKTSDTP
jgi:hypothetical protein